MKRQQARNARERILAAGRQLFLERGFEGTSTETLAQSAGVSKRTLYHHYPTKEDLFTAVMREMAVGRLSSSPSLSLHPEASPTALQATLERFVRLVIEQTMNAEYIDLFRLAVGESGRRPELAALLRRELAGSRTLRSFLEDAQQQALIRADVDIDVAARMLVGAILTSVVGDGALSAQPRPPSDAMLDELVRLFLVAVTP